MWPCSCRWLLLENSVLRSTILSSSVLSTQLFPHVWQTWQVLSHLFWKHREVIWKQNKPLKCSGNAEVEHFKRWLAPNGWASACKASPERQNSRLHPEVLCEAMAPENRHLQMKKSYFLLNPANFSLLCGDESLLEFEVRFPSCSSEFNPRLVKVAAFRVQLYRVFLVPLLLLTDFSLLLLALHLGL